MGIAESVPHMHEELERLKTRTVELTRGLSIIKEGLENFSDFLVVDSRPRLIVCEQGSIFPQPSHVDQRKVAGPRCQSTLVTTALCLIF